MIDILKNKINEAAVEFADREYEVGGIDYDALCKGFFYGAEYALSHQWINVEEALPENYTRVLVINEKGRVGIAYLYQDKTYTDELSGRKWSGGYKYVTHWMRIPKFKINKED